MLRPTPDREISSTWFQLRMPEATWFSCMLVSVGRPAMLPQHW